MKVQYYPETEIYSYLTNDIVGWNIYIPDLEFTAFVKLQSEIETEAIQLIELLAGYTPEKIDLEEVTHIRLPWRLPCTP